MSVTEKNRHIDNILTIHHSWSEVYRELQKRFPKKQDRIKWWNTPYQGQTKTPGQDILNGQIRPVKKALGLSTDRAYRRRLDI